MIDMDQVKPYRIVARLKNNRLWQAIVEKWPDVQTQSEAARRLKISVQRIGHLLNMSYWPAEKRHFEETGEIVWTSLAEKIWFKLEKDPDYLFDPKYYRIKPLALALEFKPKELEESGFLSLEGPDVSDLGLLRHDLIKTLATLTPRQEQVLRARFGVGEQEKSMEEIGEKLHMVKQRVGQIEAKALRKLRYPGRSSRLKSYVDSD